MKNKQKSSLHASVLQITLRVILISFFAALLTFAAMPAGNQFKQKPTRADMAVHSAQRRAAPSKSSATAKQKRPRKSERVEISASRQRVSGREIAGFSARTTQQENLTPPAGLKPVEQEAWLAMARRGTSDLESFYPAHYGEPFVVEGQGVRVAVRPVGGTDVTAQIHNSQVTYRNAYPETDSVHVVNGGHSEEFLFLQSECAPREFAYEISELSAGTRMELVKGEVRFTNKAGHGAKIEAPWLIEANGARRADAVHWELDSAQNESGPQRLRLVMAAGLRYPAMIDPSWTLTGNLNDARSAHTATLLLNGKVLVAGGRGAAFNSNSAELYDPTSGTWTLTTGSLNYPRFDHTATLLPNGEVLVAGGVSNSPSGTSSAELYHPTTGMWTLTGSLNGGQGRREHTATLLPSGQVLVAGGFDYNVGASLSSAELYNPETGIWTATGSLNEARDFFTATLLHTGKVLVAGGTQSGLRSAELYDPATGIWTATGSLGNGRTKYTATLLPSGKVLVAGGSNDNDCELYDPASGTWGPTDSLNDGRGIHTATLLSSDTVLVAGGEGEFVFALNSAELYASACGGFTFTNPTSIAINDVGIHPVPASPYPSNIMVAGMPGLITNVTVKLNNITHGNPADIDMLLIGPGGQTAIIMSDSGGCCTGISNVTLTLDDLAVNPLPVFTPAPPVTTGIYQPTNYQANPAGLDTFPSPCPQFTPSPSSALSAFNATNPNGTWSLYVVDDRLGSSGNIAGGWELTIATDACPSPTPTPTATATATATFTPTPTATATDTPTPTATATATATDTPTPTATATATATNTPTPTATATATATDTPTPTATATATATDTPTPTATATATATNTPTPTATATATATFTPTPEPTATFTPTPTATATATATDTPTPTATATATATAIPTATATPTPTATPAYAAQIQQPINADGSSVFNVKRGVIPVQFTLTLNGVATCALPPATIALTRTAGGTIGPVDEEIYTGPADNGSNFRIDSCQYVYNLAASALGVGTYRVDILINGNVVDSATFALR